MPAVVEFVRAVNASADPGRVAEVVVSRAGSWLPGTRRAVVMPAPCGGTVVLAGSGLGPREEASVRAIGARVLRRPRVWSSADLGRDGRVPPGPAVAAVALPLACGMRAVAALIALDSRPAVAAPRLPATLRRALGRVLETAAIALDNARRTQRAERLARTDDLTGLCNVRALTDTLRRELARASRAGRPVSLIVLDVDGFKGINDSHGHLRGNRALVEMAGLLRESTRQADCAARLGGDEFAVVLPDTGRDGAVVAGDRLRARIAHHVFLRREGLEVRLAVSVGAATANVPPVTAGALLERADKALYRAKAGGGDRTACDGPGFPAGERAT